MTKAPEIRAILADYFEGEPTKFFDEAVKFFEAYSQAEAGAFPRPSNAFSLAVLPNLLVREPGQYAVLGTIHPDQ